MKNEAHFIKNKTVDTFDKVAATSTFVNLAIIPFNLSAITLSSEKARGSTLPNEVILEKIIDKNKKHKKTL